MNPESANDVGGPGETLRPMEALDSDDVRNDDGDDVVDPPEQWSQAHKSPQAGPAEQETLDDKLAAERPDPATEELVGTEDAGAGAAGADDTVELPDDQLDRLDPQDTGVHAGQVSGTPEDGDSFFEVIE